MRFVCVLWAVLTRALFAVLIIACGAPVEPVQTPCYLAPDTPECSCDDGDPCTYDVREFDGCKHDAVTYGELCVNEPGFCDVGGICRETCDDTPCIDWHIELGFGCVYEERPNGWTCTESGAGGICRDGVCSTASTRP